MSLVLKIAQLFCLLLTRQFGLTILQIQKFLPRGKRLGEFRKKTKLPPSRKLQHTSFTVNQQKQQLGKSLGYLQTFTPAELPSSNSEFQRCCFLEYHPPWSEFCDSAVINLSMFLQETSYLQPCKQSQETHQFTKLTFGRTVTLVSSWLSIWKEQPFSHVSPGEVMQHFPVALSKWESISVTFSYVLNQQVAGNHLSLIPSGWEVFSRFQAGSQLN